MEFPASEEIVLTPIKTKKKHLAPLQRYQTEKGGMIQVIFGPMFSGKTTELLRRMRRYRIRGDACLLLKTRDTRYTDDFEKVVAHDQHNWLDGVPCDRLLDSSHLAAQSDVIGIDEGQFFPDILEFCEQFANMGKVIIIAALDSDFRREPFGNICQLVAKAERVSKLHSICHYCKEDASFSVRVTGQTEVKVVGGADKYRPVCRDCYFTVRNMLKENVPV